MTLRHGPLSRSALCFFLALAFFAFGGCNGKDKGPEDGDADGDDGGDLQDADAGEDTIGDPSDLDAGEDPAGDVPADPWTDPEPDVIVGGGGPAVYFTAFPARVTRGGETTLSWEAAAAESCTAGGSWSGPRETAGIERVENITAHMQFHLVCSNADGNTGHGVRVMVTDAATRPCLEDADLGFAFPQPGTVSMDALLWPRLALVEGPGLGGDPEQYSKYDALSSHVWQKDNVPAIQAIRPEILYFFHVAPEEHQLNNMPFTGTGPATSLGPVRGEGIMYAGHWVYFAGTTLAQALNETATTVYVEDASGIEAGQYVVIYDAPAGSFNHAEHAEVRSVNTSATPDQVVLEARGYLSDAAGHAAGSVMAQHKQAWEQGVPENWSYNLSSTCPRDANGMQFIDLEVPWIVENMDKDQFGEVVPGLRVDGIYFDADPYFGEGSELDVDNDLSGDGGFDASGANLWGEGMENFITMLSHMIPDKLIIGGDRYARGFRLNGTQMESCPCDSYGNTAHPTYERFGSVLAVYTYRVHHSRQGPEYTDIFNRLSTQLYPIGTVTTDTNAAFRMAFGFTLLDDGFYAGEDDLGHFDPWWDEYAVDVTSGSPTYGRSVASDPTDESAIREHKGWMGSPLGPRFRLYDPAAFDPSAGLISNGGFESGIDGWNGTNVSLNRETAEKDVFAGTGSLHASEHLSVSTSVGGARIVGPAVSVEAGESYSVSFMIKSSVERELTVRFGWDQMTQKIFTSPAWRRIVVTATAETAGNRSLILEIGRESTEVWIDDVCAFEGSVDILRRDYEHGIVVLNATPHAATVDLGGTFLRILGTGQDPINDGSTLTQVTIDPFDAAILVRPE